MKLLYLLAVVCLGVAGAWAAAPQVPQSASAAEEKAEASLADIAARFAQVQTIQSRFVQEKHMSMLTEPLVSTGFFIFKREPSQLRWEYKTPFQNGFLITEGQSFRLEKGQKQPLKNKMATQVAQQMFVWLAFDVETLSKTYHIEPFPGGLRLSPLSDKNPLVAAISVWFAKDNPQAVARIEMTEQNGDKTLLHFSGTSINQPVAAEAFE